MREVVRARNASVVISGGLSGLRSIQFDPSGTPETLQITAQSHHELEYDTLPMPPAEPIVFVIEQHSEG
ncbi:hypothetical protein V5O48_009298 [Marasmius crinis-equi]|uniref:Uncharacterized protein n=1 Tax=Marasmius crinis-equi TaxID=585013 RepID=A0ABR3FBG1_9AGAR